MLRVLEEKVEEQGRGLVRVSGHPGLKDNK